MKKTLFLLLALTQIVLLAACSDPVNPTSAPTAETAATEETAEARAVPSPATAPNYAAKLSAAPTIEEMRQVAVGAMRDMLTIQWFPQKTLTYSKSGAASQKKYHLYNERIYLGLPYTSAGKGIYQFLEYYDSATGMMTYTDPASINNMIGNTCASSPAWALFTVTTSIRGRCISNFLTASNGFYPLGKITYPATVTDFADYTTVQIIEKNGDQTLYEAYALAQPADLIVYSEGGESGGHTRMVIEAAHVERDAKGAIDPEASYLTTQEQAAGDNQVKTDGVNMTQCGKVDTQYTFAALRKSGYIPVTVAEFRGDKAYEKTSFIFSEDPTDIASLQGMIVSCNRPMAVMRLVLTKADGKEQILARHLFDRYEVETGEVFDYPISDMVTSDLAGDVRLPKTGTCTLTLAVTAADGVIETRSFSVTR